MYPSLGFRFCFLQNQAWLVLISEHLYLSSGERVENKQVLVNKSMPIVTSTGLQPGKCHYCYRNGNVNQSFNQSHPQKASASLGSAGLQKW